MSDDKASGGFLEAARKFLRPTTTAPAVPVQLFRQAKGGTCPGCGYWNHPDAQVSDDPTSCFCNNCGHVFDVEGT